MNLAENFKLDPEKVLARAQAYSSYVLAKERHDQPELADNRRADFLTISGSYFALVDPYRSREMFRLASIYAFEFIHSQSSREIPSSVGFRQLYARAILLQVCGMIQHFESLSWIDAQKELVGVSPTELGAAAVYVAANGVFTEDRSASYLLDRLLSASKKIEAQPVGRLRLPLSLYMGLAERLVSSDAKAEWLTRWVEDFGVRLSERVAIAQASSHQWNNLNTSLLPIEPEALATLIALIKKVPEAQSLFPERHSPVMQAYFEAAKGILAVGAKG